MWIIRRAAMISFAVGLAPVLLAVVGLSLSVQSLWLLGMTGFVFLSAPAALVVVCWAVLETIQLFRH
jgi:hypothetical protein